MASTPDMAPSRPTPTPRRAANGTRRSASSRSAASVKAKPEEDLAGHVEQLQKDLKAIAASLTSLAEGKVGEAQDIAKREVKQLARTGQHALEEAQDEFTQIEKQIKDTIRERPLTAVAGAVALGFVLALIVR